MESESQEVEMAYSLPIEVYDAIRKAVKDEETAKEVAKAIEKSLEVIDKKAEEKKVLIKAELKDELRKELATKEDIVLLQQEIEATRREFRIYMKFITLLIVVGFTLFNPQFYDLVKSLISLFKP